MHLFLVERRLPGASQMTESELAGIARRSLAAIATMDVPYRWVVSYAAGDKIYCFHEAPDAGTVLEHARRSGFPADSIEIVAHEFGPAAADRA